jgi:NtrC-family two-component system sensor histidine kinase KinB
VDLAAALRVEANGRTRRLLPRLIVSTGATTEEHGGLIVVLSDVTELARLDEMRAEYVAVASHELRTPVTTLRMSLLMLSEGAARLEPRTRDLVSAAIGGVDQLGNVVDELLDMTRIEAGKLRLNPEPVELRSFAKEAVARWQARSQENGVRLTLRATDVSSATLSGDRARLKLVLDNILNNALKYTPRGGAIELALTGQQTDSGSKGLQLTVSDDGPGIPAEFRTRVFEKFFRVEHYRHGSDTGARGSGIGLYLCKQIVELHKGEIRCESGSPGRGTRIIVTLPLEPRALT